MTAVDTTTEPTVRISAHANCDHPRTKVARAACRRARRAGWITIVHGDERIAKGMTVRVTVRGDEIEGSDELEGTLLGWGAKRLIVRADDERFSFNTADVIRVEMRNDES